MATDLRSSVYDASDIIYDYVCTLCAEEQLNAEASFYCNECLKYYCHPCVKLHEKLHRDHAVWGQKEAEKWGMAGKAVAMEMCLKHPGKELEMFCSDHDVICCVICVSVNHRQCKLVEHLPDVAKGFRQKEEFRNLPISIKEFKTKVEEMREHRLRNKTAIQECSNKILAAIDELYEEFNKQLNKIKQETVKDLERLQTKFDDTIQLEIHTCANLDEELTKVLETIEYKNLKDDTHALIAYRKGQEKIDETKKLLLHLTKPDYEIMFTAYGEIKEYLSNLRCFGECKVITKVKRGRNREACQYTWYSGNNLNQKAT